MNIGGIKLSNTTLLVIGGIVGFLLIGVMFLVLVRGFGGSKKPVEDAVLQFWGVYDDPAFYGRAIETFSKEHPNIKVVYKVINYNDYERELINSFAAGTGPDIFLIHHTWLPKIGHLLQPMPEPDPESKEASPFLNINQFKDQFVDVVADDLTRNDRIYGMPLYVDTLGLYYNKDIFNSEGIINTPKTYEDLNLVIGQLTRLDQDGNIQRSALPIGTVQNINRPSDILAMLMLQSGVKMNENPNSTRVIFAASDAAKTALQYYTDFANPQKQVYTWNDQQPYSIDAFINGKSVMMFNYSHHIRTIRSKSARFNFAVATVPQISNAPFAISYPNYWAPAVAKSSKNGEAAWEFLTFLGSARGAASYINASNRPAARKDFIEQQRSDPDLGPFAIQALYARSWNQIDNVKIEQILGRMIEDVNLGRADYEGALGRAGDAINLLSRQGGL